MGGRPNKWSPSLPIILDTICRTAYFGSLSHRHQPNLQLRAYCNPHNASNERSRLGTDPFLPTATPKRKNKPKPQTSSSDAIVFVLEKDCYCISDTGVAPSSENGHPFCVSTPILATCTQLMSKRVGKCRPGISCGEQSMYIDHATIIPLAHSLHGNTLHHRTKHNYFRQEWT